MEIAVNADFTSRPTSSAPTNIDATLTISGAEIPQTTKLQLVGKSTSKWVPEAIRTTDTSLLEGAKGLTSAFAQAGLRLSLMLLPQLRLPTAPAASTVSSPNPTPTVETLMEISPEASPASVNPLPEASPDDAAPASSDPSDTM